jgi:NAD(P)-dependent dehydrogenase (short-subunit alcohol dehydrogenase family)
MDDQRTWFVTGCDSGMGRVIAETALAHGEKVVATGMEPANFAALAEKYPERAFCLKLDVTKPENIASVVAEAERLTGGIDVLMNNAGYGVLGPAEDTTPAQYRPMFEVNFFGMAEVTRAVLPFMRGRRRGWIISTSSSGGYAASPGFSFYAASKFALEGFCDALSQEVASLGIKVIVLEPGSFRTNFAGSSMHKLPSMHDDYKDTAVVLTLDRMAARDGAQPGDPRKLAAILVNIVREPSPPFRLVLGDDAIDRLRNKVKAQAEEFERWAHLATSVSFDAEPG